MAAHNRPSDAERTLAIHAAHRPPAPVLRYIDQVVSPVSQMDFRYSQGVLTDFSVDVVHVADAHLNSLLGTRGAGPLQRVMAATVLASNLRRHGIALVRTLQDPASRRAPGPLDRLVARILDRATSEFITLDEVTASPDPRRTTVIPHSHYRDRFVGYPTGRLTSGRMLCLGNPDIPSAGLDLLSIPRVMDTEGAHLRLAGLAPEESQERIQAAAARRPATLSARLERLSSAAQVREIDDAEIVIVPDPATGLADLQLVFLALSRDRAVLTPSTPAMQALADSVGAGWLHLSTGPVTAVDADAAFASARDPQRSPRPSLDGRDGASTNAAYENVFRRAAASALSGADAA